MTNKNGSTDWDRRPSNVFTATLTGEDLSTVDDVFSGVISGSAFVVPIQPSEESSHADQGRGIPCAGPRRRQLSAADICRRPPGFPLPADVDRDPVDRAVQRPVPPLRHLEESRQGGDSQRRPVEDHDAGPEALARAGPRRLHRRRGPADAVRGGSGLPCLLARPPGRAPDPRLLAGPDPHREDGHGPAVAGDDLVRRHRRDPRQDPRQASTSSTRSRPRSRRCSACAGSTSWAT